MSAQMVFTLDVPPTVNEMISLAKQRVKVGRKVLPVVYDRAKDAYEIKAIADIRNQGYMPPRDPWARWRIEHIESRRHNLLDTLEAVASCKWVVDSLVRGRYVNGDGPHQLLSLGALTQKIDRQNKGVTLIISQVEP